MIARTLLVCIVATGVVAPALADETSDRIRDLLRDLDAPQKSARDAAEQGLLDLGPEIVDLLPAGEDQSAEVRLRLDRVRGQLERQRADRSIQGSRVTLSGDEVPLSKALDEIRKQTGNTILDYRDQFNQEALDPKLKLNFENAPFWKAIDEVMDQGGLAIYAYPEEPGLALVGASEGAPQASPHKAYVGAFAIEALNLTAERDLRNPAMDRLTVNLQLMWEPRITPIVMSQSSDSLVAEDSDGGRVEAAMGDNVENEIVVTPGSNSGNLPLSFALPARGVDDIAKLSGRLDVLLLGPVRPFRFDKLAEGKRGEQRLGNVKVELENVRRNNFVWEVRVRVTFDEAGQALESHRNWILHNRAVLEMPGGETLQFAGLETTSQSENQVGVAYLFDAGDAGVDGATFVYETATSILPASIDYELTNLPLP